MFTKEIDNGITWVLTVQNKDGGWGGPFKEYTISGVWTTAGVLYILSKAGKNERILSSIIRGLSFLEIYQNKDGGFPRVQYDLSSTEASAFAVICLKELEGLEGIPQTKITSMLEKAKNYIIKSQNDEGSWGYWHSEDEAGRVIPTAFAIIALSEVNESELNDDSIKETVTKTIEKGIDWLKKNKFVDGGWGYTKTYASNPMATSVSVLAIVNSDKEKSSDYAIDALKWLKNNTLKAGGWHSLQELQIMKSFVIPSPEDEKILSTRENVWRWFSTPFCICALVAVGESPMESYTYKAIQYLLTLQHGNGGWAVEKGEDPQVWATYQAIRCLYEIENKIDLARDFQVISEIISELKSDIQKLNSDPDLYLMHKKLIEQYYKSPTIYIGTQGLYMSKRIFFITSICILTLLSAFFLAINYYPFLLISLSELAKSHFKIFIGVFVGVMTSLIMFIIYKIYEAPIKEVILGIIALWFSIALYIY